MIGRAFGLAAGLAMSATPIAVAAAPGLMAAMFAHADQVFASRGFRPTGWARNGVLPRGHHAVVPLLLSGSSVYEISGICDDACGNLDLELLDADGRILASDHKPDDFALITVPASGRYAIRVVMVTCAKPRCAYGVRSYID